LAVDLFALVALSILATRSEVQSWTADGLFAGFFLIPLLAATQLRPWVGTIVAGPTVAAYFGAAVAAKAANGEPWASILVRTLVLAGLCAGCVALSWLQRSRVLTIGRLLLDRTVLVDELLEVETRERRTLAEHLHDGALQYVLAARQDLDDARQHGDPTSFARVAEALDMTSTLLRSTVGELHPAVLEQAGLPAALSDLVRTTGERGRFATTLASDGWPSHLRTPLDGLLFFTARELLTNVVKHAGASTVAVTLTWSDGTATLSVVDDGRGIGPDELARRLAEGHIGVSATRVRIDAAGGQLSVGDAAGGGTAATVVVPAPRNQPDLES
jgi:two-component system, NarL family, sensor kinase